VRFGAGGVLAGLLRSSYGLPGWCDVVGGCVFASGMGRCGVGCVDCGVMFGVGVVLVVGLGVGSALVVWSIVVVVCLDICGGMGGGSMCAMWGGKCDGNGGILVVVGVSVCHFLQLS
jgi:hypothetical protein